MEEIKTPLLEKMYLAYYEAKGDKMENADHLHYEGNESLLRAWSAVADVAIEKFKEWKI